VEGDQALIGAGLDYTTLFAAPQTSPNATVVAPGDSPGDYDPTRRLGLHFSGSG
jgi:hypothetical protein